MRRIRRPWVPWAASALPLLLSAFMPGCGPSQPADRLRGVPLSAELRPAVAATRRSLAQGDAGDAGVRRDLARFYGLWEMFQRPEQRAAAEDSLFALWSADLASPLWPELAAFHRNLIRDLPRIDALFSRSEFPDSASALGTYLRQWRRFGPRPDESGFRRAWEARSEVAPWLQTWLTLRLSRSDRNNGRVEDGIRLALDALPTARALGGWWLEMEAWLQLERALRAGDHLDDALHAAAMLEALAGAVSRQTGNGYVVPLAWQERAEVLGARREVDAAMRYYTSCVDTALSRGLTTFAAAGLNAAGIFTAGIGEYERGLDYYRRGLVLARAERDSFTIPRHLTNIGRRHLLLGDLDSCRVYLDEAGRWIAAYPDPDNVARFPLYQAEYYAQVGDFAAVDSLHALAARLQPNAPTMAALAERHLQLIRQGLERGHPDEAYRFLAVLDSLRGRIGSTFADRNESFDLELASAEFLARQGLFERAAGSLDEAEAALLRRPDPNRRWELSRARGNVSMRRGDPRTAELAYRSCLEMGAQRSDEDQMAQSRLSLAAALLEQGDFDAAQALFPADTAAAYGGRFRTRVSALLLGAIAESRSGRFEAALRRLDRARAFCRPESPPDLLARMDLESGRALAGLGRRDQAQRALTRVRDRLASARPGTAAVAGIVLDGDLRREWVETMLGLVTSERGALQGTEAVAALRDAAALLPEWRGLDSLPSRELLSPQLVYFVGLERSYRWNLGGSAAALERLPGEDSLLAMMSPVLADLQNPGRTPVASELAALAAALGGIPASWPAGATLTIVPDGPLFAIPWPALPAGDASGSLWIDRGPLRLADRPALDSPSAATTWRDGLRLLALGVDSSPEARHAGLGSLRNAEREAREVYGLWPAGRARLLTGAEADWRKPAARALSEHDVIHVSSHALVYQGAADRTTLLLAGTGGGPLTAAEIGRLELRARLVYVSCCEAAEGVRRGVGPAHAGLARSFLAAGARTVIAPSVRIDDESARRLAGRFYRHWMQGGSVAAALRQAQLDLRNGDPGHAHPGHWAFYQAIER